MSPKTTRSGFKFLRFSSITLLFENRVDENKKYRILKIILDLGKGNPKYFGQMSESHKYFLSPFFIWVFVISLNLF